jgi:hypothetical protein
MSVGVVALLVLLAAPVAFGGLFVLLVLLEGRSPKDPGRTPFDFPQWWW